MSCKSALSNSVKSNSDTSSQVQAQTQTLTQAQWAKQASTETNVKLAGEEAKDRLYEPKHKKKLVRVLTVVAYIFSVSLAAIMLSLYYIFIWNPYSKAKLLGDGGTSLANKQQIYNNCPELRNQEALAQIKVDDSLMTATSSVIVGDNDNDDDNDDDAKLLSVSTTTQESVEFANFYDEASSETKIESNEIDNMNIESYENSDADHDILIFNKTALK